MESKFKYPRTKHAPWSLSVAGDDKVHSNMDHFKGMEVVVTEKMDGENTTMYSDHYHARSLDSKNHPSRNAVKQIWGNIRYMIPTNWRVCGENLYAEHSIAYDDLKSYFYGFNVWDERNVALEWDATKRFLNTLGIVPVNELYRGIYDEKKIKALWDETRRYRTEGYVIRSAGEIPYDRFGELTAKFVRTNHVNTDEHWMTKTIIANKLQGA